MQYSKLARIILWIIFHNLNVVNIFYAFYTFLWSYAHEDMKTTLPWWWNVGQPVRTYAYMRVHLILCACMHECACVYVAASVSAWEPSCVRVRGSASVRAGVCERVRKLCVWASLRANMRERVHSGVCAYEGACTQSNAHVVWWHVRYMCVPDWTRVHECPCIHVYVRTCAFVFSRECTCLHAWDCACMRVFLYENVRVWENVPELLRVCVRVSMREYLFTSVGANDLCMCAYARGLVFIYSLVRISTWVYVCVVHTIVKNLKSKTAKKSWKCPKPQYQTRSNLRNNR